MPCKFHSHLTCNSQQIFKNSPKKFVLWLVFRIFSTTPFYPLRGTPQFLAKWKVSWRYIILAYIALESFISIAFVVAKLWIFKFFRRTRKVDFRLLLGDFLSITRSNAVEFFWDLDQWCSARQSIICNTVFYIVLKVTRKEDKKLIFWLFFRGFLATLSYNLWVTP